ncbi:DNA double-strand break repair Rad50 ATPase [uncultured archaeon]|nr:DNA double-strand break repair Rad50 ATPase [uncultured archaeon]
MLNSLTLRNWRTHKETTLEFGKGTNVIIGVMGSGKSSVVNAISYSLFGTFPAMKNKSVSLKEVIMNKPNPQSRAETAITFEQDKKKYRVERIIKADGTNEAKLYEESRLIAGPKQKDVNEKVEMLLGLNYELFSRAVYAEQNEMDFFLKLSPGERKKKFDELLELEKYEEARKNSITLQNEMLKENKQIKDYIEQQKNAIKNHEEEKLLAQIKNEEKEIILLEKEIIETKKELALIEKEYSSLLEKEKQNKLLEDLLIKLGSRIDTLKEDIAKNEKISLKEVQEELVRNKKEAEKFSQAMLEKEKLLKEALEEVKKHSGDLKVLEYKKKEVLDEEKGISSLKGKCPTCKQELNEEHKTHLTKEYSERLAQTITWMADIEKKKKIAEEKAAVLEKEKEKLRKENDEVKSKCYKLEAAQKEALSVEEKKKQLANFTGETPKVRKQLAELGFDKKKLEMVREENYKKKSSVSVAETKIKSKLELKKSYEGTISKIAQIRKSIEEQEKGCLKKEEAAQKLGVFANCLIAAQVELRESLLQTINSAMTSIWQAVYPYKDFTDARLCVTSDGYDLQVMNRNGEWVRVEGILSGGERSAAALCIRMAFALVLTKKLSMLILDEPTHNLDSNAVQKLSEMLREEMPKLVEQVFVITHDKELENAASSNLYLLTRNKNLDEPTKVEVMNTY